MLPGGYTVQQEHCQPMRRSQPVGEHMRTKQGQSEGLATAEQAMEFLQIGRTKLWELGNAGHITRVHLGGRAARFTWKSLRELVARLEAGELDLLSEN